MEYPAAVRRQKTAKANLDFVVYTCIAFEFMHLIYTYSKIFKF